MKPETRNYFFSIMKKRDGEFDGGRLTEYVIEPSSSKVFAAAERSTAVSGVLGIGSVCEPQMCVGFFGNHTAPRSSLKKPALNQIRLVVIFQSIHTFAD